MVLPEGWGTFLSQGILSRTPVDPWFLSDVLLIPLSLLPMTVALKFFAWFQLVLIVTAMLLLLRRTGLNEIERTVFLLLFLFAEPTFLGRILIARPFGLITAASLFLLWAVFERKWAVVAVMMAISVLLSQLFVFPLVFCIIAWLCAVFLNRRDAAAISLATLSGLVAGFLLYPHLVAYLQYLLLVFLRIPFLKSAGLSIEMRTSFINESFLSVIIVVGFCILLSVLLRIREHVSWKRFQETGALPLMMLTILFSGVFLVWARAIDLLWPLLVILFATLLGEIDAASRAYAWTSLRIRWFKTFSVVRIGIFMLIALQMLTVPLVLIRENPRHSLEPYAALQAIPSGSRVLNFDWDLFSVLLAVRPDLHYATGIDPVFTHLTDPEVNAALQMLGAHAETMNEKEIRSQLAIILSAYPADALVLSHSSFEPVIRVLKQEGEWKGVGESSEVAVFLSAEHYESL